MNFRASNTLTDKATDLLLPLLVLLLLCFGAGYGFESFIPMALGCGYVVVQKTVLFLYTEPVFAALQRAGQSAQALMLRAVQNTTLALAVFVAFQAVTGR
jgi:hypothetical protein